MNRRVLLFRSLLILSFLLCCGVGVLHRYVTMYARDYTYAQLSAVPANSVGLVLGTSPRLVSGKDNPYFISRMHAAAALFHSGKVKTLLVSGDNGSLYYNEPLAMKRALIALGVPASAIVLDHAGFRTLDSVIRCHKVFGQQRFTVISQAFQAERAVFIARQQGLDVVSYNAPEVSYGSTQLQVREAFARTRAFLDLFVWAGKPRFLGAPIPLPS